MEEVRYYTSIYYMDKQAKLQLTGHGSWSAYHAKAGEDGRHVTPIPASADDSRNWRQAGCAPHYLKQTRTWQGGNMVNWPKFGGNDLHLQNRWEWRGRDPAEWLTVRKEENFRIQEYIENQGLNTEFLKMPSLRTKKDQTNKQNVQANPQLPNT